MAPVQHPRGCAERPSQVSSIRWTERLTIPCAPRTRSDASPALLSLSPSSSSQVNCKAAIAFFQYSVLANFYWLLVEGMYLQTLLLLTFTSDKRYIWWYILIGWGECGPPRHISPSSKVPLTQTGVGTAFGDCLP